MSLWLRRKDPDGRMYYVASGAWGLIALVIPAIGILIAMILPIVQSCRAWLRG